MIKVIHQLLPYVFYLALIISIVKAYMGKFTNPKKDNLLTVTLILAHTQLLLGIYLMIDFISKAGIHMGESANRFIAVEHPLMMIMGIILITIGKVKAKKIEDIAKANKTIFNYFTIALVLISLCTPWDKFF